MTIETAAPDRATELLTALGQDFTLPAVDLSGAQFQLPSSVGNALYNEITTPTIDDLTDTNVGGAGSFDKIMTSTRAHLQDQFDKGLITGDQYTKAYIALTEAALSAGLQMLLSRDQAHWQAVLVQIQARRAEIEAVTSAVQLETAKAQLAAANRQAELVNAQYVLTAMQIANEDMKYKISHEQIHLVEYQTEAARAQTRDTLEDGVTGVSGMIGRQKDLYTQQITSYDLDAKYKVGKMYLDGWITQKTLDEGLVPPTQLTNAEIEDVLLNIRTANGLGA